MDSALTGSRVAHLENQMDEVQKGMRNMQNMLRILVEQGSSNTPDSVGGLGRVRPATLDEWVHSTASPLNRVASSDTVDTEPHTALHAVTHHDHGSVPLFASTHPVMAHDSNTASGEDYEKEDEEFLLAAAAGAGLKHFMHRDEEERLRQESLASPLGGSKPSPKGKGRGATESMGRLFKRLGVPIPTPRGDLLHDFPDPVQLGYCTEEEGQHLFDL